MTRIVAAAALSLAIASVSYAGKLGENGDPAKRDGDEIVVGGELIHTGGATVVLWNDPDGMDLMPMSRGPIRRTAASRPAPTTAAGSTSRAAVSATASDEDIAAVNAATTVPLETVVRGPGVTRDQLRDHVDQLVMHFDACGVSKDCFRVLNRRKLSIQFMVDLDGTIYQAMDVNEAAQHATIANARSIGIEIANVGTWGADRAIPATINEWYKRDANGTRITIPDRFGPQPLRTPDFIARPARYDPIVGVVQGNAKKQYDFTREQYQALAKLTAALCTTLPKIQPDFPRQRPSAGPITGELLKDAAPGTPSTQPAAIAALGEPGGLIPHTLTAAQFANYQGVLGHYHVQTNKDDPGPAFQWMPLMTEVRKLMSPEAKAACAAMRGKPASTFLLPAREE